MRITLDKNKLTDFTPPRGEIPPIFRFADDHAAGAPRRPPAVDVGPWFLGETLPGRILWPVDPASSGGGT